MFDPKVMRPLNPQARRTLLVLAIALGVAAGPASAQTEALKVHAYTLKYQRSADALMHVRPLLSSRGTVEEQPGGNTLVLRDTPAALERLVKALMAFDRPPQDLRLKIQLVRAGNKGASPSSVQATTALPAELVDRLRGLLRYDDYQVLAEASLTSKEGEEVTYSLGNRYDVSFRVGNLAEGQRLKLEGFRIAKEHPANKGTNKGRQLKPQELFHASLNLQLERLFTLVLAAPPGTAPEEALMVAITCQREGQGEQ